MAVKKGSKKVKEEVSLQQIAEEMNTIMQYGFDEDTGETNEAEQIDTELEDNELLDTILGLAATDLRPQDEESFSSEVWEWFMNNGITPTSEEDNSVATDAGEEEEEGEAGGEEEGEVEEKVSAKNPAKKEKAEKKDVKDKPIKKQVAKEKREPKERAPSNEQVAIDAVKEGKTEKDLLKIFTKIYNAKGKDDADYIATRTAIYYGIACKALGKVTEKPAKEKPAKEKPVGKKEMAEEAEAPKEKAKPKLKKK